METRNSTICFPKEEGNFLVIKNFWGIFLISYRCLLIYSLALKSSEKYSYFDVRITVEKGEYVICYLKY